MTSGNCRECKYFRQFDRRRFFCTGWVMALDMLALDNTGCLFWSRMDDNNESTTRRSIDEDKEENEKWKKF